MFSSLDIMHSILEIKSQAVVVLKFHGCVFQHISLLQYLHLLSFTNNSPLPPFIFNNIGILKRDFSSYCQIYLMKPSFKEYLPMNLRRNSKNNNLFKFELCFTRIRFRNITSCLMVKSSDYVIGS